MEKQMINNYLNGIQEGKVWDKVKQVWRDHKGKIIAGAAIAAGAYGAKTYSDNKKGKETAVKAAQSNEDRKLAGKTGSFSKADRLKQKITAGTLQAKDKVVKTAKETGQAISKAATDIKNSDASKVALAKARALKPKARRAGMAAGKFADKAGAAVKDVVYDTPKKYWTPKARSTVKNMKSNWNKNKGSFDGPQGA